MKNKTVKIISIILIMMLSCQLAMTASFALDENIPSSQGNDGGASQSAAGYADGQNSNEPGSGYSENGNSFAPGYGEDNNTKPDAGYGSDISLNEPENNIFRQMDDGWYYIKNDKIASNLTSIEYGTVNGESGWWFFRNGKVTFETTVDQNANGWWYVKDGKVDFDYTGLGHNEFGDWYCEKGAVKFNRYDVINGTVNGVRGWWLIEEGKVTFETKLASNALGWWYCRDGKVDFDYTGFAENANGWWYVENGQITFKKNDIIKAVINGQDAWWLIEESKVSNKTTVAENALGWWYVKDGKVDFDYTGFAQNESGWWYVEKGSVSMEKNDITEGTVNGVKGWYLIEDSKVSDKSTVAKNAYGWWNVKNGKVDFDHDDFGENALGWWYAEGGKVNFNKTGIVSGTIGDKTGRFLVKESRLDEKTTIMMWENEWLYLDKGYVDTGYSGIAENEYGSWYVEKGKVNFDREDIVEGTVGGIKGWWYVKESKVTYATTVAHNFNGWWYVKNGKVDFSFTGIGTNGNGSWYCENGKVKFTYNGIFSDNTGIYSIKDGKVDTGFTGVITIGNDRYYVQKGVVNKNFSGWIHVDQGYFYVVNGVVYDDQSSVVFTNNVFISPVADGNIYVANSIPSSQAGISNAKYQLECVHACYCDVHMWTNPSSGHQGIDIRCWEPGKNLLALADGKVVYVHHQSYENDGGYGAHPGEAVAVDFGNGLIYEYHEMQANSCKWNVGDTVHAGDVIGKIGVTGVTTGYHIHLSVIYWTGAENVSDEELSSKMPQYKGPSSVGSNGFVQINPLYFFGYGLARQSDYWYSKYPGEWYGSKLSVPGDPRSYSALASRMTR